ncbi:MAG: DUF480 domain-containing protein [Planctomycetes bacterium]|nr:DUF480 domain-containing protein [Planctomycetota bacterium]
MLDPIQQRVLGVLIEKELAVPDSYPLTEASLLAGCNQKSNRDPEMSLESHDIHEALLALRESGWVTRIDGSSRSAKYRHNVETMLGVNDAQKAILCELLVRGAQAPGALKPRIARMGIARNPAEIGDELDAMARRPGDAIVEQEPKRPRERDQRWAHRLGPASETGATDSEAEAIATPPSAPEPAAAPDPELEARVERLERQVLAFSEELYRLRKIVEPH